MGLFPRAGLGFLHWTDPVPLRLTPASTHAPPPQSLCIGTAASAAEASPPPVPSPVTTFELTCALLRLCIGPLWHRVAGIFPMAYWQHNSKVAQQEHNRHTPVAADSTAASKDGHLGNFWLTASPPSLPFPHKLLCGFTCPSCRETTLQEQLSNPGSNTNHQVVSVLCPLPCPLPYEWVQNLWTGSICFQFFLK